jgi:hypothetical protein
VALAAARTDPRQATIPNPMLADKTAPQHPQTCCVCGHECTLAFTANILRKRPTVYFRCARCGLIVTETPTWLEEAYQQVLPGTDTGVVDRASRVARRITALFLMLRLHGRGIDFGGGYGLLTRMLRDSGLDFYWNDPNAHNTFARGFEAIDVPYEFLSLIEVIEHVPDPIPFLQKLIGRYQVPFLFFTTELHACGEIPPLSWPYYAFESGQHVCFHTIESLTAIGTRLGYLLSSSGPYHLLSRRPVSRHAFSVACSRWALLARPIAARLRGSKTISDSAFLLSRG